MKNRILLLMLMLPFQFLNVIGFAQTINWKPTDMKTIAAEYRKVADYYNRISKVSMQITYTSFQTHTSTAIIDKSIGFYKKDGLNYHTYIMGNRTIQNSKYKFTINEESKTILVWNPDKKINTVMELDEKRLDSTIIVSLQTAQSVKGSRYRIEYQKGLGIEAIEYFVSKTGFVNEIEFFYCRNYVNEEGANETVYPRLNILFTDINTKYVPVKNDFENSKYFFEKDSVLYLNPTYKLYKIRDYRSVR